jgi:hypothetical protein
MRKWRMLFLFLPWVPLPVCAQDIHFLDCAQVAFYTDACPATPPPQYIPPAPPDPLFTRDTVARDTPPSMMRLLDSPTPENARAFLDWQTARLARAREVQALLRQLMKGDKP